MKESKVGLIWFEKMKKSYANFKRKDIEFSIGEKKKVVRFGKKGKLSPKFIGSYEGLERIEPISYPLALLPELDRIHNVFHVLML
ncbi:integrase [Gossypium australe]|uniref:Integrase n=1 Tax=Gossypium australe TaxID=47621 RepID=A0A5B6VLN2_9ROSI|nr:integrase [Gossypium australe]